MTRGSERPTALITGISGQDGTYLAEELLKDGYSVHGLVRSPTQVDLASPVTFHLGDLLDAELLRRIVVRIRPDEIYNLAGQSSVASSWSNPVEAVHPSGTAVVALLSGARELQLTHGHVARLVQASSAEMFGTAAAAPQSEATPISPVSPYGAAKALGHFMVGAFRSEGVFASSCILYNHESPRRPRTFVARKITSTVAQIARGQAKELVLGNLDVTRDWGWAPDYVRALRLAARHSEPTDFVIGSGVGHTVRQFVAAAFAVVGIDDWEPYVRTDQSFVRPIDPSFQLADSKKAHRLLGWSPDVRFADLVERMVNADLEQL